MTEVTTVPTNIRGLCMVNNIQSNTWQISCLLIAIVSVIEIVLAVAIVVVVVAIIIAVMLLLVVWKRRQNKQKKLRSNYFTCTEK